LSLAAFSSAVSAASAAAVAAPGAFDPASCDVHYTFDVRDWVVDYLRPTKDLGGKAARQKPFDLPDDKKKAVERSLSDAKTAIAKTEEAIATTVDEIKALEAGIKALDKSVAEATEQRKEENEAYKDLMASDGAAKDKDASKKDDAAACVCKDKWTLESMGEGCGKEQKGCPAEACDGGGGTSWCVVTKEGCATDKGGWAYCGDAKEAGGDDNEDYEY